MNRFDDAIPGAPGVEGYWQFDSGVLHVHFVGTDSTEDVLADLKVAKRTWRHSYTKVYGVHSGFSEYASRAVYLVESIMLDLGKPVLSLMLTGHSLGAAIATLAGYVFAKRGYNVKVRVCGSPRVGGLRFKIQAAFLDLERVEIAGDPVTHLPPVFWPFPPMFPWYLHVGRRIKHPWTGPKTPQSLIDRHQPAAYQPHVPYQL